MDFEMRQNCKFQGITNVIVTLGWRQFVKEPETTIKFIIHKLYANVPEAINNKAKVWGVLVPCCPYDINAH